MKERRGKGREDGQLRGAKCGKEFWGEGDALTGPRVRTAAAPAAAAQQWTPNWRATAGKEAPRASWPTQVRNYEGR